MLQWLRRRLARPHLVSDTLKIEAQAAEDHLVSGNFELAEISYSQLIEKTPHVAFLHARRGRALDRLGRERAAISEFETALKLDSNDPEALFGLGVAAERHGAEPEALVYFEKAFAAPHPNLEAGLRLADASFSRGAISSAVEIYQKILDIDPNSIEAHYGIGQAAMLFGREEDAIAAFHKALAIAPNSLTLQATTVFEGLFSKPSARRPKSIRPLICVPIVPAYYQKWLGGQNYLLNFARILSNLPKSRRPRVLVAALWDNARDADELHQLCIKLFETDVVIGAVNKHGELIRSKPILDRMAHRRVGSHLANRLVDDLMSIVDCTYPILYPMWNVPAIPGPLFWIPDLQHRFLPSFFSLEEIRGRDRDMRAVSLRNASIVLSSNAARRDFGEHFPQDVSRTYVWHFVSQLETTGAMADAALTEYQLPQRFYYTPNQAWQHKDHVTLFHALRRILDRGYDFTFVCTGSDLADTSDAYSQELLRLVDSLSLGDNLRLLGVLPRNTQIEIMRRCTAVIQPSLFEGWSTVIEDTLSIGRPLLASDIPVHREQLGDNGLFFAAGDPDSLAIAVISLDSKLNPGPDAEREATALRDLEPRMEKSGSEFLNILARQAASSEGNIF